MLVGLSVAPPAILKPNLQRFDCSLTVWYQIGIREVECLRTMEQQQKDKQTAGL